MTRWKPSVSSCCASVASVLAAVFSMGFDLPDRFLMRQRSSSSYVIIQIEKLSLVEHFLAAGFQIDGKAMTHLLKMEKRSAAVSHIGIPHTRKSSLFRCGIGTCAIELLTKPSIGIPNTTAPSGARQLFRMIVRALAAGIASA